MIRNNAILRLYIVRSVKKLIIKLKRMNDEEKISDFRLVFCGFIWVMIPGLFIVFGTHYIISTIFIFPVKEAGMIGIVVGLVYWFFSIRVWILWALRKDVSTERLLLVSKRSWILCNESVINAVIEENHLNNKTKK